MKLSEESFAEVNRLILETKVTLGKIETILQEAHPLDQSDSASKLVDDLREKGPLPTENLDLPKVYREKLEKMNPYYADFPFPFISTRSLLSAKDEYHKSPMLMYDYIEPHSQYAFMESILLLRRLVALMTTPDPSSFQNNHRPKQGTHKDSSEE